MKKNKRKSLKVLDEARGLFESREYEKALDLCEDALIHSIKNEEAWKLKTIALGKLERNDEAVFAAEKRMGIFPESELAIYDYCLELVRGGMENELKKFFEKMPKDEPRSEGIRKIFEGLLALKQGKKEEAKKLLGEGTSEPGIFLVIIDEVKGSLDEVLPKEGEIADFVKEKIADSRKKELEMLKMVYGLDEAGGELAKIAEDKELGAMGKEEFEEKLFKILSSSHAHGHAHEHSHEPTKEDMDAVFEELEKEPEKYREEYSKFLEERTRPGWRYKEKELFAEFVYLQAKKKKHEKAHGHEEGEEHDAEEKEHGLGEEKQEEKEGEKQEAGEKEAEGEKKEKKEHSHEHKEKEKKKEHKHEE